MAEQIVYLCGCSDGPICKIGTCHICNEQIRAVNITALERVAAAAREYRLTQIDMDFDALDGALNALDGEPEAK